MTDYAAALVISTFLRARDTRSSRNAGRLEVLRAERRLRRFSVAGVGTDPAATEILIWRGN